MASIINAISSGAGGVAVTGDSSGVLNIQTANTTAISVDASQNVTFTNGANLPNTFGFKNRIINGAMMIDQRNAGASGTAIGYTVDRWTYGATQASKFTWQQNAGTVTPPTGFKNYLGFTSSSAYSVLTGDIFTAQQVIEGFNIADLAWGTASAATVTLSFWVRSSLTGTFGGSITNSTPNRSYPFSYTISSANTWEQKTITIAGDTTGTWATDNTAGIRVYLGLGVGSTYSGTAGSWAGADYRSATGATSVVGTNGATFYITGVQLEKGSTATSFDYRDYGRELMMCQRYYWNVGGNAYSRFSLFGGTTGTGSGDVISKNPVSMRTTATLTVTSIANTHFRGTVPTAASVDTSGSNQDITVINITVSGTPFTAYQAAQWASNNSTATKVEYSAEL